MCIFIIGETDEYAIATSRKASSQEREPSYYAFRVSFFIYFLTKSCNKMPWNIF